MKAKFRKPDLTIRFTAALVCLDGFALLTLPKKISSHIASGTRTSLEGTLNGYPFRANVELNADGSHFCRVNDAIYEAIGAEACEAVSVEITRVGNEPETRTPADLRDALATIPAAQSQWTEITPLARRDWILWISSARQSKTRRGRIQKACSMLASGKKRVCCFGGLNWLTKDFPTIETWRALPT
jgi:hypothetical protein